MDLNEPSLHVFLHWLCFTSNSFLFLTICLSAFSQRSRTSYLVRCYRFFFKGTMVGMSLYMVLLINEVMARPSPLMWNLVDFYLFKMFILEQSDLFLIMFNNQKLCGKRVLYNLCYMGLLFQTSWYSSSIGLVFFYVNNACNMFKNFMALFGMAKYLYCIFMVRTIYFFIFWMTYAFQSDLGELVLPLVIVCLTAYDFVRRFQRI